MIKLSVIGVQPPRGLVYFSSFFFFLYYTFDEN